MTSAHQQRHVRRRSAGVSTAAALFLLLAFVPAINARPLAPQHAHPHGHFVDGETIQAGRWSPEPLGQSTSISSSTHRGGDHHAARPAYGVGIEFEREKLEVLEQAIVGGGKHGSSGGGGGGGGGGWSGSSGGPSSSSSSSSKLEVCPLGSQRCQIWEPEEGHGMGSHTLVERFECINPETSISHCGGCLHAPFSSSLAPPLPSATDKEAILAHHGPWGGGTNCSAIPGVREVACTFGRCIIDHCLPGWAFNRPEMRCEHIDDPSQEGYLEGSL